MLTWYKVALVLQTGHLSVAIELPEGSQKESTGYWYSNVFKDFRYSHLSIHSNGGTT